ncbi:class I SAM-dependent methyltransferase [Roseateles amylovorans]|uniref:Class I SAM-dependent methyltransferase n=1 Tax=Roseateles amylovorans TaxID=2978473 RepID=A0ABY6B108_9BURK|nr:class I SAM-dependent methyltransferase [Roseateles amylovorans]UXH77223.1 class I SAM-dependent methyltransferase [Roseateles amylovorans]
MAAWVFEGSGPGAQTKDGCSVEVYRRSRYAGELEEIRPHLPSGAAVLELGCGTGLLTHRLLEFGCQVTGVDNSAEMLAHVSDRVRRIHADIEGLTLPERFDVVLLPSGLINHADPTVRGAFLAAARRHVAPDGHLIVNCHDAAWLRTAEVGTVGQTASLKLALTEVSRTTVDGEDRVHMVLRYTMDSESWTHAFWATPLDESAVKALLLANGFQRMEALDERRRWFAVRPG